MEIKDKIIKKLGGYTEDEHISAVASARFTTPSKVFQELVDDHRFFTIKEEIPKLIKIIKKYGN